MRIDKKKLGLLGWGPIALRSYNRREFSDSSEIEVMSVIHTMVGHCIDPFVHGRIQFSDNLLIPSVLTIAEQRLRFVDRILSDSQKIIDTHRNQENLQLCVTRKQEFVVSSSMTRKKTVRTVFQTAGRKLSLDLGVPSIRHPLPEEDQDQS